MVGQKNTKLRTKPQTIRPTVPYLKSDAENQTKLLPDTRLQQVVTSDGNKMIVTMNDNRTQMIQQVIPQRHLLRFIEKYTDTDTDKHY